MLKFFTRTMPIVVNFIQHGFGLFFAALIAAMGGSGWQISLPSVAAGIVYPVATFCVGMLITPKRVTALIAASGLLIATAAAGIYLLNSFCWLVVWSIVVNVAVTMHAVPIQLLLKRVQGDRPGGNDLVKTVSIYLIGVSIGQGLGVLLCGHIPAGFFCAVGFALGVFMIVVMALVGRAYPAAPEAAVKAPEKTTSLLPENGATGIPRPVVAGWVLVGLVSLALSMMAASVTFRGSVIGLSEAVRANVLSTRSFVEGAVVFLLLFSRNWMNYRWIPSALAGVFCASLLLFGLGTTATAFYIAGILCGVGLGMGLFYVGYHALGNSAGNGKYCIVSEIVIGVTQFLGPAIGSAATPAGSGLPFLIEAAIGVAITLFLYLFLNCGKVQDLQKTSNKVRL